MLWLIFSALEPWLKWHFVITYCLLSFGLFIVNFEFSSVTTERNVTKVDREQVLKVLYQVCAFQGDPSTKMAAQSSD